MDRFFRRAAALLLTVVLCAGLLVCGAQADTVSARQYNIMLVIDGSGSLVKGSATDADGSRYDAVNRFLGLLTNQGNYVGAIVFDDGFRLDRDVQAVSGNGIKRGLADDIQEAGADGDTDIGAALARAVERLTAAQEQNGLPSVIVLMTDGITDLDNNQSVDSPEELKSWATEEQAVADAAANGIAIYSVWLNGNGAGQNDELQMIADGTDGAYREVAESEDLYQVYEDFYSVLFDIINRSQELRFDSDGHAEADIEIPSFGVDEFNIILDTDTDVAVKVTRPDGTQIDSDELEDACFSGKTFKMYKIVRDDEDDVWSGTWHMEAEGNPDSSVNCTMILNEDLQVQAEIVDDPGVYYGGTVLSFCAYMYEQGEPVGTDHYNSSTAILCLENMITGETQDYPMTSLGNSFTVDNVTLPTADKTAEWQAYVTVSNGELSTTSNGITLEVNSGSVPVPTALQNPIVLDLSGQSGMVTVSLDEYFSSDGNDDLTYELTSSDYTQKQVSVSGSDLVVNTDSLVSGTAELRAVNAQGGACRVSVQIIGNSAPYALQDSATLKVTKPVFGSKDIAFALDDWFADDDGDELTYTLDSAVQNNGSDYDTDTITVSDGNLIVRSGSMKKGDAVVRAADPDGASAVMTVHFKVINSQLFVGGTGLIILLIALAILIGLYVWRKNLRFRGLVTIKAISNNSNFGGSSSSWGSSDGWGSSGSSWGGSDGWGSSGSSWGGSDGWGSSGSSWGGSDSWGSSGSSWGSDTNADTGVTFSLRGTKKLGRFVMDCGGIDPKTKLSARGSSSARLKSGKPFYLQAQGAPQKQLDMRYGTYTIYADAEAKSGLEITLKTQ